jgi:hypothetical protein
MKADHVFMRNQAPLTTRIIYRDSIEMPRVKCMYFRLWGIWPKNLRLASKWTPCGY